MNSAARYLALVKHGRLWLKDWRWQMWRRIGNQPFTVKRRKPIADGHAAAESASGAPQA